MNKIHLNQILLGKLEGHIKIWKKHKKIIKLIMLLTTFRINRLTVQQWHLKKVKMTKKMFSKNRNIWNLDKSWLRKCYNKKFRLTIELNQLLTIFSRSRENHFYLHITHSKVKWIQLTTSQCHRVKIPKANFTLINFQINPVKKIFSKNAQPIVYFIKKETLINHKFHP